MHQFTRCTDKPAFTCRHGNHHTTTVYFLRPPHSHSSSYPWLTARETNPDYTFTFTFRHPLTSKPHSFTIPPNFDFFKLYPSDLAVSYRFGDSYPVDNLFKFNDGRLLALYGGGRLQTCPRYAPEEDDVAGTSPWVKLSPDRCFDDITVFRDNIYALDRQGWIVLIHSYKTVKNLKIGRRIMTKVTPGAGGFGWRKRFVVDGGKLYMVVRDGEKSLRVYLMVHQGKTRGKGFYWKIMSGFDSKKVLFMGKDHYFFRKASEKFPGREYRNCIVFSEAAFPQYGKYGWEYTHNDRQLSEDDIAVYRFEYNGDEIFAREGDHSVFPKIDWSPPAWIFNADEFQEHLVSESSSLSEREPDEDDKLDSGSGNKNDGEVQSDLNDGEVQSDLNDGEVQSDLRDTKGKYEEEQEEMETDFGSLDQDQDGVVSHSDSQNKEGGNMHCDLNSREKEDGVVSHSDSQNKEDGNMHCDSNSREKDEEMYVNANTKVGISLQEDVCHVSPTTNRPESGTTVTQTPSLSATEKEITQTLLSPNAGNNETEEENLRENIIESVRRAHTSSTRPRQRSDFATAEFEGFDIRPDLVPTLHKIWQKHGNILENSAVRSEDIIARGLESLATMVHILGDNSAMSLNDSQANYLASTLSDLRYIRFKVDWLIPFVEKAEKLHKSKPLVESLNSLSQLSSQAKERRAMLLNELTKLDMEENKRKEEMAKVSNMLPFCGQVKFDELLGTGLI